MSQLQQQQQRIQHSNTCQWQRHFITRFFSSTFSSRSFSVDILNICSACESYRTWACVVCAFSKSFVVPYNRRWRGSSGGGHPYDSDCCERGARAQMHKIENFNRTHCFESPICVTACDDHDENDNSPRDRFRLSLPFTISINGWMEYSHFDAVGSRSFSTSFRYEQPLTCLGLVFFRIVLSTLISTIFSISMVVVVVGIVTTSTLWLAVLTISFNSAVQSSSRVFPYTLSVPAYVWIVNISNCRWHRLNARTERTSEWDAAPLCRFSMRPFVSCVVCVWSHFVVVEYILCAVSAESIHRINGSN